MSEQKRYTAQEMREMANNAVDDVSINYNGEYYYEISDKFNPDIVRDMLRQAAEDKDAKDAEIAELRERIKIAEDALKRIDNMCDGDMCKFFDSTHHCSACRYLNECQTGVAHAALAAISEKGEEDDK